jgi:hypothetical protein
VAVLRPVLAAVLVRRCDAGWDRGSFAWRRGRYKRTGSGAALLLFLYFSYTLFFSAVQFGKLLFRVTKCLDGCLIEDEMKWSGMSLYRCTEYFISIQNEAMW